MALTLPFPLFLSMFLMCYGYAQDGAQSGKDTISRKLFSIETKVGVPDVLAFQIEGIAPIFGHPIAFFIGYGSNKLQLSDVGIALESKKIEIDDYSLNELPVIGPLINNIADAVIKTQNAKVQLQQLEYGLGYYFNRTGSGWFTRLSHGFMQPDYTFQYSRYFINAPEPLYSDLSRAPKQIPFTGLRFGYKTTGRCYVKVAFGGRLVKWPTAVRFSFSDLNIRQTLKISYPGVYLSDQNILVTGVFALGYRF